MCVVSRDALDRAQPCLRAAHVFQELLRRGWTEATAACGICVPRTVGRRGLWQPALARKESPSQALNTVNPDNDV